MSWCPSQWSENSLFVVNIQFFKLSFFQKMFVSIKRQTFEILQSTILFIFDNHAIEGDMLKTKFWLLK